MAQWQSSSSNGLKRGAIEAARERLTFMLKIAGWCIAGLLFCAGQPVWADCSKTDPCSVPSGRYQIRMPLKITPQSPVVVFYHGWRETPEMLLADPVLTGFAEAQNVILVAPEGLGQTWSYPGSPGRWRDERPFAEEVFAAVRARFPDRRVFAAGFSQGASMVWWLACRQPHLASAYVSISGGFWEPSPASCSGTGATLVHVHGRGDVTVPLAGRAIRGGAFRQSDIQRDWLIWLGENACVQSAGKVQAHGDRSCTLWSGCGSGRSLAFCLHDQGHQIHAADLDTMRLVLQQLALWP